MSNYKEMILKKIIKSLGCVLKTVERCNINCTYCYFFNGKDNSYLKHSPYISSSTIEKTASFFKQGCIDLDIDRLTIGFHGGEPLMQKKAAFAQMCEIFLETLSPYTIVHLTMQTNGMLIDDEWIKLFAKYKVHVGISIDGNKEINDKYRIDKLNRGTYEQVVQGLKLMQDSDDIQKMGGVGVLSVVNPEFSGKEIYRHFVDDLKINNMDFLLQHFTHDDVKNNPNLDLTTHYDFLCDIFDEWVNDDNPNIEIRVLNSSLEQLMGGRSHTYGNGARSQGDFPLITISSDGHLSPVDDIRSTNPEMMTTGKIVDNCTLVEFLELPIFRKIKLAATKPPEKCSKCYWLNACGSGDITNRYSGDTDDFNYPSVFCDGLQKFYSKIAVYALKNGYSFDKMVSSLELKNHTRIEQC
jgi:uncharacterized protein